MTEKRDAGNAIVNTQRQTVFAIFSVCNSSIRITLLWWLGVTVRKYGGKVTPVGSFDVENLSCRQEKKKKKRIYSMQIQRD